MTFDSRQLSFIIIISIAIHPRHHHCRHHHHHHHHFSCLLPPAFFQATLSSSVFIHVRVPYHFLKQNFFSISPFRYWNNSSTFAVFCCSMFLEPCLGNCSWIRCLTLVYLNLAWEPVLGSLAWEPVLGNFLLGTCSWEHCLITCSWKLSLGNLFLETLPACFKPVHWDLAREPVFRNFAWEPCLGTCPSEPCLGFCYCFQPCVQLFFDIL